MSAQKVSSNASNGRHKGGIIGAQLVAQASQAVNTYATSLADPAMFGLGHTEQNNPLAAGDTRNWSFFRHTGTDYESVPAGKLSLTPSTNTPPFGIWSGPTVDASSAMKTFTIPRPLSVSPWNQPGATIMGNHAITAPLRAVANNANPSSAPSITRTGYPAASAVLPGLIGGAAVLGSRAIADERVRANVTQAKHAVQGRAQQVTRAVRAATDQVRQAANQRVAEAQHSVTGRINVLRMTAQLYALVGVACLIIACTTISLTIMHLYNGKKQVAAITVGAGTLLAASMSTIGRALLGI